jgi:hypothetical protein
MKRIRLKLLLMLAGAFFSSCAKQVDVRPATEVMQAKEVEERELYIPSRIWNVPDDNDYSNEESEFSYKRMDSSANFALFWSKAYGSNPSSNTDPSQRFNTQEVLAECERFYNYYINELKFLKKGKSTNESYKILIYVINSQEGTAYGGGADEKVGILWVPPPRMASKPYGALAHELGHSIQYLVRAEGAWGFSTSPAGSNGQPIFEMTSQYMLWHVYPEWMTFENYHLNSFMQKTHYSFLHETNQYHSPYVLEYWSEKHGKAFIGKLWQNAQSGEDPVMAYKRITGTNQSKFNDEMFDAARRFITWDLSRVEQVASPYANQHTSKLDSIGDGWYRIAESKCPQNYGYNGIKLKTPSSGSKVSVQFKGLAGIDGFRKIKTEKAGWRYGFLAVKEDGSRLYGEPKSAASGAVSFVVPKNTKHLWLVVSGAPKEHWEHLTDWKDENDEQWPYQIKLKGTGLDKSFIN